MIALLPPASNQSDLALILKDYVSMIRESEAHVSQSQTMVTELREMHAQTQERCADTRALLATLPRPVAPATTDVSMMRKKAAIATLGNVVYAATQDGHVWVTTNDGSSWTQTDPIPGFAPFIFGYQDIEIDQSVAGAGASAYGAS